LWGCICSSVATFFNNSLRVRCLCLLLCHAYQMFIVLIISGLFQSTNKLLPRDSIFLVPTFCTYSIVWFFFWGIRC
jgi:hypothetical protein